MGNSESIDMECLNIILIGRAGVGKSTLVNNIFGEEIAQEGNGSPCTKEVTAYTKENFHLTLYDTPSFGINSTYVKNFKKEVLEIINDQAKTKNINKLIHCIWFCIDSNAKEINGFEKEFISLFKNIPVIIVLTKSKDQNKTNELMRQIELQKMNIKYIVPILAKKTNDVAQFGIENLINFTVNSLPPDIHPLYSYSYLNFKKEIRSFANHDNTLQKNNVIVIGKTGVGKSTLINCIFGAEVAETGIGKPVTKEIREYGNENSSFSIFDTPGLELNENQKEKLKKDILKIISDRSKTKEKNKLIHCIWYCVRCESKRIEKYEQEFINALSESVKSKDIPIFLVLTQCYSYDDTKKMIDSISSLKMNIKRISPIVAKIETFEEFIPPKVIEPFGVDELKSFTNQAVSSNYVVAKTLSNSSSFKDDVKNLKKINVAIIGSPKAGRKSLIKKLLDDDLTISSYHNSNDIIEYQSTKSDICFFKGPVYEDNLVKQVKLRETVINLIQDKLQTNDFKQLIHCVWYCIPCTPKLFNDKEMAFVKTLIEILHDYKIPVILVLTKCNDSNFKDKMIAIINEKYNFIHYYQPIITENDDNSGYIYNNNDSAESLIDLKNITNAALSDTVIFNDLDNHFGNDLDDTLNNLSKINIIAVGKSGVGKSTLINNFFRGHLAATGIGVPVTQRITPLTTPNSPLTIYDTPGFELNKSQQNELKKDIIKLIKYGYKTKDINKHIHCIWFCINAESGRYEESEIQFIEELTKTTSMYQVPVFIILTQSYRKTLAENMMKLIEADNLNITKVIMVVAETKKIDGSICKPFGLDVLTEEMGNKLPNALKISFNNVQIASMSMKRKCAGGVIAAFVASSAAVGASPIPFSDCFLLAGLEAAMLSSITAIYNLDITSGFISTFISCAIGCTSASLIGRTIVVNLIKCIPLAGSIAGGVIGGITGAVLTGALGSTYLLVIDIIIERKLDPKKMTKTELKALIKPLFLKELEKEMKKEEQKE